MSELTVGRRLGERYEVERLLGEGGLARVYQVRHLQLGTRYALKQLSVSRKGLQTRLLREGRIQAQLQHPNVVRVLDVLDVNGQPSLIMEYVEGISLEELIRTEAPLTADLALPLFGQILAGVAAAHNAGVLHRDLKPANVLLSRTSDGWMAKVADFGIAKMAVDDGKGRTRTGIQMGTPGYMAPEQVLDAADVDARADIFALGVVLYEMLVGCRPFGGTSEFQTLDTTVRGQYRPVGEALEHCPDAIRRAVSGSLARHPDDRYASCRELAEVVFADHPELLVPVEEARGRVLTDEELATDRSMPTQHTGGQEVGATLADLDALGSVFTDPEKMVGATLAPSDSAVRSQVAAATEEEPTGRPAWLFGGVLGVGAAVVGAALVLVAGVLVILMFGPGTSTDVAAEEQSESSAAPVATATPADPSAAPAEAGVGSEETEVIDRSSTVSEPVRDVAPEPAAELAAGQPEAAGLATEPQPSLASRRRQAWPRNRSPALPAPMWVPMRLDSLQRSWNRWRLNSRRSRRWCLRPKSSKKGVALPSSTTPTQPRSRRRWRLRRPQCPRCSEAGRAGPTGVRSPCTSQTRTASALAPRRPSTSAARSVGFA